MILLSLRGVAALTARATVLVALCCATGATAYAETATHKVRMYWNFGEIEVELYGADTPRHVANFLRYAADDLYDDTIVHRVQAGSARFVQGGGFTTPDPFLVQNLVANPLPSYAEIVNEFDPLGDLSNTPGSLAAARTSDPDSATNQWFFNVTNNAAGFDTGPYTVFGQITAGFDEWFNQVPYLTQLQTLNAAFTGQYEATTPFAYVTSIEAYVPIVLGETVEIPLIAGDFNLDGYVDAADELVWQAGQGDLYGGSPPATLNLTADADGDADVDAADRAIWEANLGQGTPPTIVAGDYNRDGGVTEADYLWWETLAGSSTALHADGNGDGVINLADYTVWRDALPTTASAAVPEPAAGVLLVGLAHLAGRRSRR